MAESLTNKVHRAAKIATERHASEVRAVIIDARQKESGSKIKPPQEVRDELHRPGPSSEIGGPPNRRTRRPTVRTLRALPPNRVLHP
jgi:hypothetical protein